jgi:hypothetical protein
VSGDRVVGPLSLARSLRSGPPSLDALIRHIGSTSLERRFRALVQRYLPDQQDEILNAGQGRRNGDWESREDERVSQFCGRFSDRYFPLVEWEELEYVVGFIPFERHGWNYDEFHDVEELRPAIQILLLLCEDPYRQGGALDGVRVVLMEKLEDVLGKPLLKRVPKAMDPETLHATLDDTPFKPMAEFIDWVWGRTETTFLDVNDEFEVYDNEWDPQTVKELTSQWHTASGILDRVYALFDWIEANPKKNFGMIVDAVIANAPPAKPDDPKRLIDIFATPEDAYTYAHEDDDGYEAPEPGDERLALPAGAAG